METTKNDALLTLSVVASIGILSVATSIFALRMMSLDRHAAEIAAAEKASRVTTTWPDGPSNHAVETPRLPGQTLAQWGEQHRLESGGLMVVLAGEGK